MGKHKHGFTLIEVSIFLAVTGLLFLSVTLGVQNSIFQQRYNDAVQNFADFLRNVYSEVTSVQGVGSGRSDSAIYGKMITFGESNNADGSQEFYVYDVIGDAMDQSKMLGSGSTLGALNYLNANVVKKGSDDRYVATGVVENYTPRWGSRIQQTDNFNDFVGTILIVRDPITGTVQTFVSSQTIGVKNALESGNTGSLDGLLSNLKGKFGKVQVDFCVNPNGSDENNNRTDIRLLSGAHNATGVEVMPLDDSTLNKCNGN